MTRLSMLIGIGLMLVGASAYALPEVQDLIRLFPAIGGIIIATSGFIAMSHDSVRKHLMHLSALTAVIILVYAAARIVPDSAKSDHIQLISDIDTAGLSFVYLYFAVKSFIDARRARKKGY